MTGIAVEVIMKETMGDIVERDMNMIKSVGISDMAGAVPDWIFE